MQRDRIWRLLEMYNSKEEEQDYCKVKFKL